MNKTKIGIVFGGTSTEHDISVISGTSVIKNLDKEKYEIFPIYVEKNGEWYKYTKDIKEIDVLELGNEVKPKEKIENLIDELKKLDVIFPVLHGLGGEDGSIQGMFELLKIPYVGCGILSSSVGLDKVYTKAIWKVAGINQVKYEYVKKVKNGYTYINEFFDENSYKLDEICAIIENRLKYPMFVKPSNSGSSVGIRKVNNITELKEAIEYASEFDVKILIEEGKNARELECAILGNDEVLAGEVGEIIPSEEFYSFYSKYNNSDSRVIIPANIDCEIKNKIKDIAIKAYKAIDAKGLARVDFFMDKDTKEIYINEINTLPGFTKISMYPKLWEAKGVTYRELLDKLINLALDR